MRKYVSFLKYNSPAVIRICFIITLLCQFFKVASGFLQVYD